ncbi:GtrA family protein [Sinomonas atrocyanea]|uniref:GtrA family protein n=1 Tax=Sinomonas atrocyanea TaxID=37927 RepID=UPI002856FD5D|nr:GtrA family protein [Sinomonas atrocyanea]MDR6623663.1 putative flippase GtrA [Sinomonas atrocyanea]
MENPQTPPEAPVDHSGPASARGLRGAVRAMRPVSLPRLWPLRPGWSLRKSWRVPVVRQLTRFTGVGVVCTLSSLALYALCRPWLGAQTANAVALIITSVMNTSLNRRFTFLVRGTAKLAQDHLNGLVALAVALLLTAGSLEGLHWVEPNAGVVAELWTTTIAGWVATAVRFSLLRHWIFRRARSA